MDTSIKRSSKTLYCLKFEKNSGKNKLFTFDQNTFQNFYTSLRSKCILDSFQKEYKLIKMIGKGSFAKVYLAQNLITKDFFAVKAFYKEQVISQSSGHDALLNEIDILRKIANHMNLLHLYEIYESKNSIYLIVDLLEGGELMNDLKPENPYKESKIASLLKNILEALAIIHKKNIIHRDLKPENVLLRSKNDPFAIVIADFGLSTFIVNDIKKVVFKRCGTPGYVAPEILLYKDNQPFYGTNSDIFSVGVMFYIMYYIYINLIKYNNFLYRITGHRPFKGADAHETLILNKRCKVNYSMPPLNKLTAQAMDLLKKMLYANPDQRISTFDALEHPFFKLSSQEHDANYNEDINSNHVLLSKISEIEEEK